MKELLDKFLKNCEPLLEYMEKFLVEFLGESREEFLGKLLENS